MGGQIMPPVMGAVAFIMAETINVALHRDLQGGADPGDPVFRHRVLDGHLEAGHKGLLGGVEGGMPDPVDRDQAALVPACCRMIGLVALLFSGYTPLFSGTIGLALTVVLIFGAAAAVGREEHAAARAVLGAAGNRQRRLPGIRRHDLLRGHRGAASR